MVQVCAKKLLIVATAVRFQEQKVSKMWLRNEILLFTNAPGGEMLNSAKTFSQLMQKEALEALKELVRKHYEYETSNLEILFDPLEPICD